MAGGVVRTGMHTTMQVIMLGTGDPVNEERAQASLAVPLASDETLLIDTSSGTILLRQLRTAGIDLVSLRHIVITHRHFDHAGGLASLLVALAGVPEARLTIYALPATRQALRDMLAASIPGVEEWLGAALTWHALAPGQPVRAGSAVVTPFAVEHGMECAGLHVAHGGATLIFSADTRPCPNVVTYARGVDLLIHEAYGPQSMAAEAHRFGHATAADAGRAAREAGVGQLLLTHLRSERVVDPRVLMDEAHAAFGGPVTLAADLDVLEVGPSPVVS